MGTLKPQSNGPLYSNTVIGTLAVDGWAVSLFYLVQRGWAVAYHQRPVYQLHIIRCGIIVTFAL